MRRRDEAGPVGTVVDEQPTHARTRDAHSLITRSRYCAFCCQFSLSLACLALCYTMDPDGYVSYRSSSTVLSEGVYQFLRGSLYGAIWGLVSE